MPLLLTHNGWTIGYNLDFIDMYISCVTISKRLYTLSRKGSRPILAVSRMYKCK